MPKKPNPLIRLLVPLVGVALAVGIAFSVAQQGKKPSPSGSNQNQSRNEARAQAEETAPEQAPPERAESEDAGSPGVASNDTPPQPEAGGPTDSPEPAATPAIASDAALVAEVFPDAQPAATIGGFDDGNLRLEFSRYGAGLSSIRVTDEFVSVEAMNLANDRSPGEEIPIESLVEVQSERRDAQTNALLTPFMVQGVEVNGQFVLLVSRNGQPVWREAAPGVLEAFVTTDTGERVLRFERRFTVPDGSHTIELSQRIENLTGSPLSVRLYQLGPIEMEREALGYGGDRRRVRFGYLSSPASDPARTVVLADDYLWPRNRALGDRDETSRLYDTERTLWPNREAERRERELVWAGLTSRYHGVTVRAAGGDSAVEKTLDTVAERVDRVLLDRSDGEPMALRLISPETRVLGGEAADFSVSVYAGPLSKREIRNDPGGEAFGLDGLVVYNFGGPCGFCTFPVLTGALLWILLHLHDLVGDWALSIILLVVVVRSCLHPITKWSQIRIQIFGKQMQGMAPKQAKLKEKYGDDPKRMQSEMAKLWREEGINPAGLLGCLPMFLQSPVWIALYATLYFSIELRHSAAFFGLFQQFGGWGFLNDLSHPDNAIPVPTFEIPLISGMMGPITGINLLPLVLGFVFYAHQKYLTPTSSVAMTPEQEQQQKIMRVMTVVFFPLLMYNAPSGLTIYFITNSLLGIVESRWIRHNAEKQGLLDLDKIRARAQAKKAGKPRGGFMQRLQSIAEEQQRRREAVQRNPNQPPPGAGKRSQMRYGQQSGGDRKDPPQRFKKKK